MYLEFFWSVFYRIRTEYGDLDSKSPYSFQMWENKDQKNSEYVHFLGSVEELQTYGIKDCTYDIQKQPPDGFCGIVIIKCFAKFTGKHLCRSLTWAGVSSLKIY